MRPRKEAVITTIFTRWQALFKDLDESAPLPPQARYQRSDCLKSLFAMFQFRRPNLFKFCFDYEDDENLQASVQRLLGITSMPSDTTIWRG